MEPLWVKGMLRPQGDLIVVRTTITEIEDGEHTLLRPVVELVDQAGVMWGLCGMNYRHTLHVCGLPADFKARYVLIHTHRKFGCPIVYSLDADSLEDARERAREHFVVYEDEFTEWYVDYASTQQARGLPPAERDLLGSIRHDFKKLEK